MNNQNSNESIRQAVLRKIQSGKIRRVPHAYFVFRIIATVVVSVLLLLISAFVFSFVFFSLHESGEQFLLGFGMQGILVFLLLFPWALFVLDILLLILLEWLLQGFKFAYRIPLLNIFLGILGVSILFGALINATPIHGMLLRDADKDQLPVIGGAYEHIFDHHEDLGVCRGIVISVNGAGNPSSFVMGYNDQDHDSDDGTFIVTLIPGAVMPPVEVGDRVLAFGHPQDERIEATNVQILPPIYP